MWQPATMDSFTMATGRATRFFWPLVRGEQHVEVGEGRVRLRYGRLGGFDISAADVERLSRVRWPWWSGIGVRIGLRMVAFVGRSGELALLELSREVSVRMPVAWKTRRIAVGVEDVEGFMRAVAHARARADLDGAATGT